MPAPDIVRHLVETFEKHRDSYRSGKYNEAQLRREFLDPLMEALGWDVFNRQGYAEAYKDVIHEDSLEVEGAAKAPDYAFRIGGTRKFFVEAKKPAVNIETSIDPAFQLRRYAWSARMPVSILTDFEEFAVYETRSKPDKSDSAATGRVMFLNYKDYLAKWDEIAGIFSREAVLKGSFDRFVEGIKGKRGTQEVDDAFLEEIEGWRDLLARNLALRNPDLDVQGLNFAVQMTIDRIVFLRICEDREIEREGQLQELLEGEEVYPRLCQLFRQADSKYNSGLFNFTAEKGEASPADDLTLHLTIDNKVLKEIVRDLYYPAPYVFREIPADILGQVYERFLGKVIRLTAGHQAKVEEKPEVRKAGGVYYTPTYIVEYIVKNTVGKLLESPTPKEASATRVADTADSGTKPLRLAGKLRIVDPACGSGSFLLGAYQYLLDWHLKWYAEHEAEKWAKEKTPPIYQAQGGEWKLTTTEKKRILLNNIYGVDIDPQAVEVTKLSLSLKVLEGESEESIGAQLGLFKERALPDLGRNIQCGNSLIGPDYFEGRMLVDEAERQRVNAFNWKSAFPHVFASGGFDAVIGNPPYIRIQALQEWAPKDVEFYKVQYKTASKGNYDIYVVFVERGLSLLNKQGRLGFILPSKFFATDYGENLRKLITERKALSQIIDFGHLQIFEQASTYTCLMFLVGSNQQSLSYAKVNTQQELDIVKAKSISILLDNHPWDFSDDVSHNLTNKMVSCSKPLGDLPTRIARGSSSGADEIFMIRKAGKIFLTRQGESAESEPEILRIPVYATDFGRYEFRPAGNEYIIFPYLVENEAYYLIPEGEFKKNYHKAYNYLANRKKKLSERKQYKEWYSFSAPRNLDIHENAQILVPLLANKGSYCRLSDNSSNFCLMASGGFSITVNQSCGLSPNYVLGLLNSQLLFWRLRSISNIFRGGWITCTKQYVETLPIHTINLSDPSEKSAHDKIVTLVERMLALHKQAGRTPQEKERIQREIEATDQQIDALVYQLYGLTEEEIKIVENAHA